MSAIFLAFALAFPHVGHWEYSRVIRSYEWVPPSDCTGWPKGLTWAGGVVYDARGCPFPEIDGEPKAGYSKNPLWLTPSVKVTEERVAY